MPDIWGLQLADLAAALDRDAITPLDLLDMYQQRIARLNPTINAFSHLDPAGAHEAATAATARQLAGQRLGPLDGIPVAIKDNLFVAGLPARWGSQLFREHVAAQDDICVERLRAAGCVIVGKTTTPEMALSGKTASRLDGITRNPWNPTLTPGGSSGGAVAAVAAGLAPLALGTDAGGSIRLPAGYTGLVGLRPSNGRIPRRFGFPPMALDFQAIGPATRTMADLDLLLAVLAGPDPRDPASLRLPPWQSPVGPSLRVGWFTSVGQLHADAEVAQAVADAADAFADAGMHLAPCPAPFDISVLRDIWGTLTAAGAARVAARFPDRWRSEATPAIAGMVERGLALPATAYVEALDKLAAFRADVSSAWGDFDAMLMPTAPTPAWPAEAEHPGGLPAQGAFAGWVNACGYAAISVPGTPHPDGRPIGVQLVAPFGADAVVLHLARLLERAAPWAERWPALAS